MKLVCMRDNNTFVISMISIRTTSEFKMLLILFFLGRNAILKDSFFPSLIGKHLSARTSFVSKKRNEFAS